MHKHKKTTKKTTEKPDHKSKIDYDKITSNIYIGTNMCCQVHFDKSLLAKGITADISVEKERLDAAYGIEYFLWLPTKDHTPPTKDKMHLGVKALQELIALKKKVYVHCKNGHGRAPTLVIAYLMSTGKFFEEAFSFVMNKRRGMHLEASQIKALLAYEKKLNFKKKIV